MQPVSVSLTWEYLARNRWMLPLPFLLALAIALLILLPLKSLDFPADSRELIGLQLILLLALNLIIIGGVFESQGSLRPLYLKPFSTAGMVGYFFWGGALLVAAQVGVLFALCRFLLGADWPIAGPVLFATVAWGWTQLLFRATMRTSWWIPAALLIYSALVYWSMTRHGVAFKEGGLLAPSVHYWSTLTGTDLAFAIASLIATYCLTIWRVTCDRSGHSAWPFRRTARNGGVAAARKRALNLKNFGSGQAALEWSDFQSRHASLPSVVLAGLLLVWFAAFALYLFLGDTSVILPTALSGTLLAIVIQFVAAIFLTLAAMKGHSAQDYQGSERNQGGPKPTPFGMSQFVKALPIPTQRIASAMLRSSARAVVISAAYLLASFALIGILNSVLGNEPGYRSNSRFNFWSLTLVLTTGSMLLTFVVLNLNCLYAPSKVSWEHWTPPVALALNMLTIWSPAFPFVSGGAAAIAMVGLACATSKGVKDGDVSISRALLLWLAGAALTFCLVYCLPSDSRLLGGVLLGTLVMLAIHSAVSTASALRLLRTS